LVNSGIMQLSQTVSVIIGTNIGTTITAWILSLTSIKGSYGFLIELFKPESFSPILALIGVCMIMGAKSSKNKNIGTVFVGFAILMFGMELMSGAMKPLADMPEFRNVLVAFTNPFLGLLVGIFVTMLVQSSSASVGILQALSMVGGVSYGMAIPIIFGQNIGTCISAILSSIGVNINAKRVAFVHVLYNVLGVVFCFPLFLILNWIFDFAFISSDINPVGIALVHTGFNVVTAAILFPFAKVLERLAVRLVSDRNTSTEEVILDDRLLVAPSFAIQECYQQTIKMAEIVEESFISSSKMLKSYHKKKAEHIRSTEAQIDMYEDKLNKFLLKLSSKQLSIEDNNRISQLLLAIGDFERIGDHNAHILKIAEKISESENSLSETAIGELKVIVNAVSEMFEISLAAYKADDAKLAQEVEPLEVVIKKIIRKVKNAHIQRLKDGNCTPEISFMFSDLMNDFRRIAAHCGNIAISIIQLKDTTIGKHEYNHRNKDEDLEYISRYKDYKSKFSVSKKDKTDIK